MTLATISKSFAIAVVAAASLISTRSADAAPGDHLDLLASRLQAQSRDLIGEFRLHYAHTAEYRHLVSDAYSVYRLAGHIHVLAHTSQSLHHIESDLRQLDRLLHHLHELVDHREIHPHGGHTHGDTAHVHRLLGQMEDTLHHMLSDVRQMTRHNHGVGSGHGRFSGGYGQFPSQSSGIIIRNGRVSLRFGR
ncbi:MAG: hypothetical protein RIC55_08310 [Pirellulaceae bacterium]